MAEPPELPQLRCRRYIACVYRDECPRTGRCMADESPISATRLAAGKALACFGPGTTRGGRAEAGWFDLGYVGKDAFTEVRQHD